MLHTDIGIMIRPALNVASMKLSVFFFILFQIPLIEVVAFVCTLQKQVAHKTCAHRKFCPNELLN